VSESLSSDEARSRRAIEPRRGRRGSRSDSMPVQPERPAVLAESRPPPPNIVPPPAHLSPRPVWDWFPDRTWLVALAGLMVGGLLARVIFGPLYYAGELVLVSAVLVLVVRRALHRRATPRSTAAVAGAPPPRKEPPPAPPTDFDRGVQAIRRADRGFDPATFVGYAAMTFRDVESARVARDADPLRDRLTPEMYAELRAFCDGLRTAGRSVRLDDVDVGAEITEAWQDGDQDYVTACIAGSILGYTVDDGTTTVVSGSRTKSGVVKAFLTFTRPAGLNFWMLSIIQERRP
jgi:Tim44-like domain